MTRRQTAKVRVWRLLFSMWLWRIRRSFTLCDVNLL